jgi:hypothetical protein
MSLVVVVFLQKVAVIAFLVSKPTDKVDRIENVTEILRLTTLY